MVEKHPDEKPAKRGLTFDLGVPFRWAEEKISQAYQSLKGPRSFSRGILAPIAVGLAVAAGYVGGTNVYNQLFKEDLSRAVYVSRETTGQGADFIAIGDEFYQLVDNENTAMSLTSLEQGEDLEKEKSKRKKVHTDARQAEEVKIEREYGFIETSRNRTREAWDYHKPKLEESVKKSVEETPDYVRKIRERREGYSTNTGGKK